MLKVNVVPDTSGFNMEGLLCWQNCELHLSTRTIVPSSPSTIFLQIDKPSPTPVVFILAVSSSLPNIWNILLRSSYLIPMPVSQTDTCRVWLWNSSKAIFALMMIEPLKVNLREFPIRLIKTCLILWISIPNSFGMFSWKSTMSLIPFSSACRWNTSRSSLIYFWN